MRWAVQKATASAPSWAQLPPTCREAVAHAAKLCDALRCRQPAAGPSWPRAVLRMLGVVLLRLFRGSRYLGAPSGIGCPLTPGPFAALVLPMRPARPPGLAPRGCRCRGGAVRGARRRQGVGELGHGSGDVRAGPAEQPSTTTRPERGASAARACAAARECFGSACARAQTEFAQPVGRVISRRRALLVPARCAATLAAPSPGQGRQAAFARLGPLAYRTLPCARKTPPSRGRVARQSGRPPRCPRTASHVGAGRPSQRATLSLRCACGLCPAAPLARRAGGGVCACAWKRAWSPGLLS